MNGLAGDSVRLGGRRALLLWLAIVAAPVAWAAQLVFGSEYEELACATDPGAATIGVVALISVVTAVIAVGGIVCALTAWAEARRGSWPDPNGTVAALSLLGLIGGVLLLATIALGGVQLLVLEGCAT